MEATTIWPHRFEAANAADAPTLLLLHGTGGDENDLVQIGRALAPNAALLSPRGPVLENAMPRFFRRLSEGVFDEDDIRQRAQELVDFIETSSQRYSFDAHKVVALGFSNGANIAAALLLLHPQVLAGALLLRPMVPLIPTSAPALQNKPVFIAAGRNDALVSVQQTQDLVWLLENAGANVDLQWNAGGHRMANEEWQTAHDWLKSLNYEF